MILRPRLAVAGIFLTVCWILIGYRKLGYDQSSIQLENGWGPDETPTAEEFVVTAINASTEDDFDYSQIAEVCAAQSWDADVIFTCREIIGGIGNVKQQLLSCIRYAIDAGAGLIVPSVNQRSDTDLSDLKNGTTSLDCLFDKPKFMHRMAKACPQLRLYENIEEVRELGPVTETELLTPRLLPHWPGFPTLSVRSRVVELKAPQGQITLVPFGMTQAYYPICHDSVLFANTFGQLLPLRSDVHYLAAVILHTLAERYRLPVDPSNPTTSPSRPTYLGIHLRTAADSLPNWPTYSEQAAYYLSHIRSSTLLSNLPVIYLASGNQSSTTLFAVEAESLPRPMAVVTKYDLLRGLDLEQLSNLTWDQQALVDYLVLLRSSYFMGMAESSFAWAIAVKRRVTSKTGSCGFRKGLYSGYLWNAALWDEFSNVMGPHPFGWEINMWP